MKGPTLIDGRPNALVLGAMQVGMVFMASDWLAGSSGHGVVAALVLAAALPLFMTALLALNLGATALARGYSSTWGLFASLSLIGVVVVYCLPDRSTRPARGFHIELTRR